MTCWKARGGTTRALLSINFANPQTAKTVGNSSALLAASPALGPGSSYPARTDSRSRSERELEADVVLETEDMYQCDPDRWSVRFLKAAPEKGARTVSVDLVGS
jgi:hypothetical protein